MYKPKRLILQDIFSHSNTVYEFKEGKAVVIVGENLDDPSQKGNGSGKSALIEGPKLAIDGSPVRDIKTKELIRRGCDYGTVELELHNSLFGTKLRIWRRFHSGTKASEVKVYEDDKQVMLSDVNEYNKFIYHMLGITREDFLSFYILTLMNYKPFLKVSDAVKKEIINRFSGAEKIDKVDPLIETDSKEKDKQIADTTTKSFNNDGKIVLLKEQIQEEEDLFSEEGKQLKIKELEVSLTLIEENLTANIESMASLERSIEAAEKEHKCFIITDYDKEIENQKEHNKTNKASVDALFKTCGQCGDKYKKDFDSIDINEKNLKESIKDNQEALADSRSFKAELEAHLAGTIECPKCSHKFILSNKEYNVEEAEEKLPAAQELIEDAEKEIAYGRKQIDNLAKDRTALNFKIQEDQKGINLQIEQYNETIEKTNKSIGALQEKKRLQSQSLYDMTEKISELKRKLKFHTDEEERLIALCEQIDLDMAKTKEGKSDKLNELQTKLAMCEGNKVNLEAEIQKLQDEKAKIDEWFVSFKNFKSHLANKSIRNIADYTNMYLQAMGSNLSIELEGYKVLSNKKLKEEITASVLREGISEGSYGTFSGGERARIDICAILAIQNLINLNSTTGGVDILICDEILDQIDSYGLECIMNSLQSVGKTIMIVSQNDISSLKDCTVIVRKQNKISTVI